MPTYVVTMKSGRKYKIRADNTDSARRAAVSKARELPNYKLMAIQPGKPLAQQPEFVVDDVIVAEGHR